MESLPPDCRLLLKLKRHIAEYFETQERCEAARASDIYYYLKNKPEFRHAIPDSAAFSRFLRRTHDGGLMQQFIRNYDVDTSCRNNYKWRFYPAAKPIPARHPDAATSHPDAVPAFLPDGRRYTAANGMKVRSRAELYILNELLAVEHFDIYYERPLTAGGHKKYPDFTIRNKRTNTVFYWEHFGMEDNPSYADGMAEKLAWYRQTGYKSIEKGGRLITTLYDNEVQLAKVVERMIRKMDEVIEPCGFLSPLTQEEV